MTVDNVEGIQLAFDHLVALGHRSIAYVAGIVGTHTAADRREAYHALARANDMAPLEFNEGIGAEAGAAAAADPLVDRGGTLSARRLPGLMHVDHAAFTVPDLDEAVSFFVEVFGAQELYRSRRGPDASAMPVEFEVPPDAALELSMLRLPPNLNIELFQWRTADQRTEHPRHSDRGGHHLCFAVEDVDEAVAHLSQIPGVRILGGRREVGQDSPFVARRSA